MKAFLNNMKAGLTDVKNMLLENNYKPFLPPLVIVMCLYFGFNYLNESAAKGVAEVKNKVEAQKAEVDNEQEYKNSKARYESLLTFLPPEDKKNEWLLTEMIAIFENNKIAPSRTGKHNLEESGIFTLSSVTYELETDYQTLGKLTESIENNDKFLRISDMLITRMEGGLGKLKVTMRVNTVFVSEKSEKAA